MGKLTRRKLLTSAVATAGAGAAGVGILTLVWNTLAPASGVAEAGEIKVWASPSCGCCTSWVNHLKDNGLPVVLERTHAVESVKQRLEIERKLWSCHTGLVDGYFLEGHVPANDVKKLLAERPEALGLAVPGMPQSAPGMDIPGEPYDVLLVSSSSIDVVASY